MDRLLTALGCCSDLSEALLENATLFLSGFSMLVPSLSWQNDADFKCKMHRSKKTRFLLTSTQAPFLSVTFGPTWRRWKVLLMAC